MSHENLATYFQDNLFSGLDKNLTDLAALRRRLT
jgi:hypothetical protein